MSRDRLLPCGKAVKTYEDLVTWLLARDPRIKQDTLPTGGRNIGAVYAIRLALSAPPHTACASTYKYTYAIRVHIQLYVWCTCVWVGGVVCVCVCVETFLGRSVPVSTTKCV
jgi:hypothetical protein